MLRSVRSLSSRILRSGEVVRIESEPPQPEDEPADGENELASFENSSPEPETEPVGVGIEPTDPEDEPEEMENELAPFEKKPVGFENRLVWLKGVVGRGCGLLSHQSCASCLLRQRWSVKGKRG